MSRFALAAYTTRNGLQVRSKLEARVINDMDRRGFAFEYEPVKLAWLDKVNSGQCLDCTSPRVVKHRVYIPDVRWLANGEFMEIKGLFTAEDRRTLIGARKDNPGVVIRILFMRDGWLSNKSKANRYSDWCYKNQFDYAIGEGTPEAWALSAEQRLFGSSEKQTTAARTAAPTGKNSRRKG
jgi:hypothetical protein